MYGHDHVGHVRHVPQMTEPPSPARHPIRDLVSGCERHSLRLDRDQGGQGPARLVVQHDITVARDHAHLRQDTRQLRGLRRVVGGPTTALCPLPLGVPTRDRHQTLAPYSREHRGQCQPNRNCEQRQRPRNHHQTQQDHQDGNQPERRLPSGQGADPETASLPPAPIDPHRGTHTLRPFAARRATPGSMAALSRKVMVTTSRTTMGSRDMVTRSWLTR